MHCFGFVTLTVDLRFKSNLSLDRTLDQLNSIDRLRVDDYPQGGRYLVRFTNGFKSTVEIWSGGSVCVHVQPCEDLHDFLQPVLDAMVDNEGKPAKISLEAFEAKGNTGTALLWANVTYGWMGITDDDRSHYNENIQWAKDTCELALAAFGKRVPSAELPQELKTPVESASSKTHQDSKYLSRR